MPAGAVTFTDTVHDVCPALRLPDTLTVELPAAAVAEPPLHVVATPGVEATTSPDGRLSVKDQPFFAASSDVLVTVKVSRETPPTFTVVGEKLLSGVTSRIDGMSIATSLPFPVAVAL
ncbi:hypothetical protein D3C87_1536330 [compost metagenome]